MNFNNNNIDNIMKFLDTVTFDEGGIASDKQVNDFINKLNKHFSLDDNSPFYAFLYFYGKYGATNAEGNRGFTVIHTKITMSQMTKYAQECGTTIRQICRSKSNLINKILFTRKESSVLSKETVFEEYVKNDHKLYWIFDSATVDSGCPKDVYYSLIKHKHQRLGLKEPTKLMGKSIDEFLSDDYKISSKMKSPKKTKSPLKNR
jgi:hypothetical protein